MIIGVLKIMEKFMKIALSTESTCDLPAELISKYEIKILPFTIVLGENEIVDDEAAPQKIFEYYNSTKKTPKTTAISQKTYYNHFAGIMENYDAVIHISLSSEISASHTNALAAAQKFRNVFVVDSKSVSAGQSLLVLYAKKLIDKNVLPGEITRLLELRVTNILASFVIERLEFLHKGGKCNSLSVFSTNLLKLHPQIVLQNGAMRAAKKYRGKMEMAVENFCNDTLEQFNDPDLSVAFITHTGVNPKCIESTKQILENRGFKKIIETSAGGTVTSHCGDNAIGIFYFNDGGVNV